MILKIVFMFPGQGSQTPGMLQDVPELVKKATSILQTEMHDDEEALKSTVWIQMALFLKELTVAQQLMERGITPQFVAGHSIGAYPAAVISGVLSFEDALKIVWQRANLMETAYNKGYGMGVVIGLTKNEVQRAIDRAHREEAPVYLSNINAEQQIAVSGSLEGIQLAFRFATEMGAAKTRLLKVPIPSHSPLMSGISRELSEIISKVPLRNALIPYLSNHRGRILRDKDKIAEDLALNVAYPVRWNDMAGVCVEAGADCFVEMPPGKTLTHLVQQSHPEIRRISVCEVGVEAALYLIQKWKGQEE
ncbi:ACP S-malonyltransferase [Paenibacillus sp. HW567]|uniref:ACP S-malonyltransferase n=1 Tax=Paenibacillus sp. HW567 TaxID=1034769 RepID=UPI00037CC314|nr:malonate decarboxylase subunit epsilon [Paenibacillus sp. HW567]